MNRHRSVIERIGFVLLLFVAPNGCMYVQSHPTTDRRSESEPAQRPARFLYAWTGDADSAESDFLAVIDVRDGSPTYAQILTTLPIGATGLNPHHTEATLPVGGKYFANGFMSGRTLLLDAADPMHPKLGGWVDPVPGFNHPHMFARLADGTVLATLQYGDGSAPGDPGGIALFDPSGRLLRAVSAADPRFPGAWIRPYSLDVSQLVDRIITVSAPMADERTADVFQIWRLSDLSLLKTVALAPTPDSAQAYPFEPRFLADGRTVLLNTYYCGLYLVNGVASADPMAELVYSFRTERSNRSCGVPLVIDHYWLMPVAFGAAVITLDISDPRHPREVSRLETDTTFHPHWLSRDPGSSRIVMIDQADGEPRIFLLRFDPATGRLTYDAAFRDAGSDRSGVSFTRRDWPHGASGPAIPHGTIFVP